MNIPKGMTESEVIDVIDRVVNMIAAKFRFGYHNIDDIKQQGRLFAIQVLNSGKYDENRRLENFLFTHIRNRLINYKRNNYFRNEPPCHSCIFFDPKYKKSENQCAVFTDKGECKKLVDWQHRNEAKKNLMCPVDVAVVGETVIHKIPHVSEEMNIKEIEDRIDIELPVELRSDYLRMRAGIQISKIRKQKVRDAIILIFHGSNCWE